MENFYFLFKNLNSKLDNSKIYKYLSPLKFKKVRFLSSKNIMLDSNLISYILIISHNLKICIDIFNKYKNGIIKREPDFISNPLNYYTSFKQH